MIKFFKKSVKSQLQFVVHSANFAEICFYQKLRNDNSGMCLNALQDAKRKF